MNFIAICMAGRVQADMNGRTITIGENQLLICPPNVTFTDFLFSHDFEFKAIFLTNRILQSFLRDRVAVWNELMYVHKMHVLTMEGRDIEFFSHFYDLLRLCIDTRTDNPYRTDIIQSIIRGALLGLCGALKVMMPGDDVRQTGANSIFQRFLDLLGKTPTKHQPVEFYASELCITPKYLSALCKRYSGKTANEWITEHVMEDIRYYLKQTDLSMKQVSDRLGFPNASFFGRYVKTHFGVTPMQFRHAG